MKLRQRYAMLTVDAEALPNRAIEQHVRKLIWGNFSRGSAGIRELCGLADDFCCRHVFFIDLCATSSSLTDIKEVVSWLDGNQQDVQLHAHPETLPKEFWEEKDLPYKPLLMNEFNDAERVSQVISHFKTALSSLTGKSPRAFRAGSFRWNSCLIGSLKSLDIPLSLNNSMRAYRAGRCAYSEPTNYPFRWSNGVIEIPLTERLVPPKPGGDPFWASLTYPESPYFPFQTDRRNFLRSAFDRTPDFKVLLLHSWSLLDFDENGHAYYKDDQRLEGYRKLLSKLTKDYDVITTSDFIDLYEQGKIPITRTVNLAHAELKR